MQPSNEIALNSSDVELATQMERARFSPVMNISMAVERRSAIKEAFTKLMEDGQDYGKVAGIGKPTLLQPGAQKLDNLFGLVPRFPIELMRIEEDWTGAQHGGEPFFRYMVVCQLMRGEFIMGEAIGECNSWESKYRYRKTDRTCPNCGAAAIMFTKKNNWWCAKFKDGCGAGFVKDDPKITGQEVGRKPNPEIFDQVNTLLKMAQKRAHVSATINATSASEFFTVDIEPEQQQAAEPDPVVEKKIDDPALTAFLGRLKSKEDCQSVYTEICDRIRATSTATGDADADKAWTTATKPVNNKAPSPAAVTRSLYEAWLAVAEPVQEALPL
jgi:ribosomal protein S27AE